MSDAAARPRPDAGARTLPRMAAAPWLVVAGTALVHVLMAAAIPLFQDETYYAMWAGHLQADYYDHPPVIALWIRVGEALAGPTPLGIRLLSVLGVALVPAVAWHMALRLRAGQRAALLAALLTAAMVLIFSLGFTATPDAPSTLFWALTTLAVVAARDSRRPLPWWGAVGLFAGLGVLSKFTNLFLGVGLALWLLATPEGRRALRRPGPWLALAIVALLVTPLLLWNLHNGGLGLERQFGRLVPRGPSRGFVGDYLLTSLVTMTPPVLWAAWLGAARQPQTRILLWLTLPFPAYLLMHALHAPVQGNWIVPIAPTFAVLAAIGAAEARRGWKWLLVGLPAVLSVTALTVALMPGKPLVPGDNPPNQTKGWAAMTAQVEGLAAESGATWIATTDYGTTGELSHHIATLPVREVAEPYRWGFLGPFPTKLCSAPGLLVTPASRIGAGQALFADHGKAVPLARRSAGYPVARYVAVPVKGLRACPPG